MSGLTNMSWTPIVNNDRSTWPPDGFVVALLVVSPHTHRQVISAGVCRHFADPECDYFIVGDDSLGDGDLDVGWWLAIPDIPRLPYGH